MKKILSTKGLRKILKWLCHQVSLIKKYNSVLRHCGRLWHTPSLHEEAEEIRSKCLDSGTRGQPSHGHSSRAQLENRQSLWQSMPPGGKSPWMTEPQICTTGSLRVMSSQINALWYPLCVGLCKDSEGQTECSDYNGFDEMLSFSGAIGCTNKRKFPTRPFRRVPAVNKWYRGKR